MKSFQVGLLPIQYKETVRLMLAGLLFMLFTLEIVSSLNLTEVSVETVKII